MEKVAGLDIWLILLIIGRTLAVPYNLPKLSPNATWNSNASTFANNSIAGSDLHRIFITNNNTVFLTSGDLNKVLVWSEISMTPTNYISGDLNNSFGLFVTSGGDIYTDNGDVHDRVEKWTWNATNSTFVMNVTSRCYYMFIDINNTLYCSLDLENKVVKMSLNNGFNTLTNAAGNGTTGTGSYMLCTPNGIVVDMELKLYVVDLGNNRVQLFQPEQLNGITISTGSITLSSPNGLALDADGYLFITDMSDNRIIGSGPDGFRCIIGCSSGFGSASDQLHNPQAISFDSVWQHICR